MEIRNKSDEIVSFRFLETNTNGDHSFEIAVVCGRYSAAQDVWIMAEEWNSFLGQLRMLDQSRQGEATLRGTTENDLVFRVHSSDKAGHMALEGHVGGTRYVGNQPSRIGLQFAFEFDAGTLADIVGAFGQLPHEG